MISKNIRENLWNAFGFQYFYKELKHFWVLNGSLDLKMFQLYLLCHTIIFSEYPGFLYVVIISPNMFSWQRENGNIVTM